MQSQGLYGVTANTTKAGLAAGTTTTYSTTATVLGAVQGKAVSKTAVTNGATPTTDYNTAASFKGIVANQGSVFVFGFDSGGTIGVIQGEVNALDSAGLFVSAPEFPVIPDALMPFGYLIAKGGSTLSGTWTFGSSNLSAVSGMTYTFVDTCLGLPDRPQIS